MLHLFDPTELPSIAPYAKSLLKWMVFASLCATLCFLTTCSNDQDPDPDSDPILLPTDVLSSLVVDAEGGILETDGFSLTVPRGAFDSETELKIYEETENRFGTENISSIYKIEGMPVEMNDPVQFKLTPSEKPDSTTFMALGTAMDFVTKDDPEFVFLLYPATETDGDLIAEFQPDDDWRGKFTSGRESAASVFEINNYLWVAVKNKYGGRSEKREITTGEFKINYPTGTDKIWIDSAFIFLKLFDNLFKEALANIGFNENTNENLIVHINKFGSDFTSKGEYIYEAARAKWLPQPIILINSNYTDNIDTFFAVLIHLQSQYLTEKFDKDVLQPDRYWYHLSIASWISSGRKKINNRNQPLNWQGNELSALNGCVAGSGNNLNDAAKHGYGMSSLFEYIEMILLKIGGTYIYKTIPEKIKSYPNLVESINQVANSNIELWWTDYIQHLIDGDLYEISPQMVLDAVTENYAMNVDADTSYVFTGDYPDLSAKLYRVNLNKNFEDHDYLAVNVTGDDSFVSVYKISDNNSFEFIDGGKDITIGELPDLVANGNDLLLLVTNSKNVDPYTGTTSIDCTIEHKKSEFPFNYCRIHVKANGTWVDDIQGTIKNSFYIWWEAFGNYENGIFKAIHYFNEDTVATMEIEVDPVTMNILDFHATETEKNTDTDYIDYDAIEGSDKPFVGNKVYASMEYMIQGEETGSYIELITSYYGSPGFMADLLSVRYDTNSELKIKFEYKQQ